LNPVGWAGKQRFAMEAKNQLTLPELKGQGYRLTSYPLVGFVQDPIVGFASLKNGLKLICGGLGNTNPGGAAPCRLKRSQQHTIRLTFRLLIRNLPQRGSPHELVTH